MKHHDPPDIYSVMLCAHTWRGSFKTLHNSQSYTNDYISAQLYIHHIQKDWFYVQSTTSIHKIKAIYCPLGAVPKME